MSPAEASDAIASAGRRTASSQRNKSLDAGTSACLAETHYTQRIVHRLSSCEGNPRDRMHLHLRVSFS